MWCMYLLYLLDEKIFFFIPIDKVFFLLLGSCTVFYVRSFVKIYAPNKSFWIMGRFFTWLSQELKRKPLRTNIMLSTTIGFCGDVMCQTVYDPYLGIKKISPSSLPPESFKSIFIFKVTSPTLLWKKRKEERALKHSLIKASEGGSAMLCSCSESLTDPSIYLDLRRSMIFCSFSCIFSVPYFLCVYRCLDKLYSPVGITKMQAIGKGFLSYLAANLTTPLYMAHVTCLDRFFINRDGRDGRRRVASTQPAGSPPESRTASHKTIVLADKSFNRDEYLACVKADWKRRVYNDFPDVLRFGIVFWGVNWLPMFYYIPPHFRLLYSSCLQVVWSGIMSYMLHRGEK